MPIAENLGWLASSRQWKFDGIANTDDPYGLKMEEAWNLGASLTQEFTIDYRSGLLALDFFHTKFTDRTIIDLDISPQQLWIYNLDGKSFLPLLKPFYAALANVSFLSFWRNTFHEPCVT